MVAAAGGVAVPESAFAGSVAEGAAAGAVAAAGVPESVEAGAAGVPAAAAAGVVLAGVVALADGWLEVWPKGWLESDVLMRAGDYPARVVVAYDQARFGHMWQKRGHIVPRTPQIMTAKRCAEFLGITRVTLRAWHRSGVGPPRELKGKRYWYALEAVREWLRNGGASYVATSARPGGPTALPCAASSSPPQGPPRKFR